MQLDFRSWGRLGIAALVASLCISNLPAQEAKFSTRLSTVPIGPAERGVITGVGSAMASLDGRDLSISGTFEGLQGAATSATLRLGPATGVRGEAIAELSVSNATRGTVSATANLSRSQVQALRDGRIYIQIDSEAGPEGNLWGWLLD